MERNGEALDDEHVQVAGLAATLVRQHGVTVSADILAKALASPSVDARVGALFQLAPFVEADITDRITALGAAAPEALLVTVPLLDGDVHDLDGLRTIAGLLIR